MKILAVDTSSLVASVSIMDDARLLAEYSINHKKTHSQKLMPMIQEVLRDIELTPSDIDLYAVSSGPGSFTGLRIGITTIKAIAYATGKKVMGVPTLDALAFNIQDREALICPIMDARNSQVYTALYKFEKNVQVKSSEYMGIHINELIDIIKEKNKRVIFNGDAVAIHEGLLLERLLEKCNFAPSNQTLQRASSVAQLAFKRITEGYTDNCFDMVPFYLRKSQAEQEYDKKLNNIVECKVKL